MNIRGPLLKHRFVRQEMEQEREPLAAGVIVQLASPD
jgi:hypothetical protein